MWWVTVIRLSTNIAAKMTDLFQNAVDKAETESRCLGELVDKLNALIALKEDAGHKKRKSEERERVEPKKKAKLWICLEL